MNESVFGPFMAYPIVPWLRLILELAGAFFQLGIAVLGVWATYKIFTEKADEEITCDGR